jgi:hypothetical protein
MGKNDESNFQKLTPVENAAVGIAAGVIEVTILQPMLYWKNATQQKLQLTLSPRVVYRGLAMSITNMGILTGLQFPLANAVAMSLTGGVKRPLSNFEAIASSFTGGLISGVVCCPMELVMVQQQRFGGSVVSTPARLINAHGLSILSRGLITSCGREALFTAGYLGIGPVIAKEIRQRYDVNAGSAKLLGAAGAGVIAATLSHPLDTIKTCMQGDIERKRFGSFSETARTLFAEGGLGRFFSGWSWRTGRMMCAVFIMGECKTILSPLMFPKYFVD